MEMTSYKPGTPSWVDLGTTDPNAAAEFYGPLFGWTVQESQPNTGGYRIAELRGKPVAGIGPLMQGQIDMGVPPNWSTYIATADADATGKAVAAAGGQTYMAPFDVMDVGKMGVFADPTGAAFGVWQAGTHLGAGIVNEPNTLCWNELQTREPDSAIPFYRDVFGWSANTQPMGPSSYTEWQLEGKTVGGMMAMDENFPAEVPPHWEVYFAVDDTDATVKKAQDLGANVLVQPQDVPPGRFAVLQDPHGAVFAVIKLTAMV
jgi:predicted enzyme related to lactoylglutathione lyase